MFPTHDLNPIAREHMQREALAARIQQVDRMAEGVRDGRPGWFRRVLVALVGRLPWRHGPARS